MVWTGAGPPPSAENSGEDVLVDTSYVAGTGLLLTRSRRWLLLDDDPPRDRVEEWWDLLGAPGSIRAQLVASLEVAYPLHEVSLVLVDLDDAAPPLTWGNGRVDADATGQRLSVGIAGEGKALPLLAGVVPAATADVRATAFGGDGALIDGIPADILESGELGPPPTRPMFRPADARDDEVEITVPRRISDVLGSPQVADDTAEPVATSDLSDHLRQTSQETVLAVQCPHGHVTPASTPTCRVCNATVEQQEPRSIPRPNLGGLRLPSGEAGAARPRRGVRAQAHAGGGQQRLAPPGAPAAGLRLRLPDAPPDRARRLAGARTRPRVAGWHDAAHPGRLPQRIRAHERYVLEPGHALDLADTYEHHLRGLPVSAPPIPGYRYVDHLGSGGVRRCLPLRAGVAQTTRRDQGRAPRRTPQRAGEVDVHQRGQRHGAPRRPPLHRDRHDGRGDRGRPALSGDALLPATRTSGCGCAPTRCLSPRPSAPASSWPAPSRPRTGRASCTATSSPATCW